MPRKTMPPTPVDDLELIDDMLLEWSATDAAKANARYTLAGFARWLAARDTTLSSATSKDCIEWLRHRHTEVQAKTVAKNWSELRAFYAVAVTDPTDPLAGRASPMGRIKMPRFPKYARTHAATVAEVDAVVRTFDNRTGLGLRNAAMISVMFRSGLRVGEVAALDRGDLDVEARTVHLGFTKNLEPRTPALHPETLTLLRRYLRRRGDAPGPLFINVGGRRQTERMTRTAVQNIVKRAATTAKVPVTPHCLRRGFVVEYLAHGGDVATLMVIGGWESETMIVRYMGDRRALTAQAVYDSVAARQVAARRRLRAVG
jgi:integrase/recombinase XerC